MGMKSDDFPGKPRGTGVFRTPAVVPQADPSKRQSRAAMLEKMDTSNAAPLEGEWIGQDSILGELNVSSIVISPYQPRIVFDSLAISKLAESISEIGLGKPILVRPLPDGRFELVGGERRWRAVCGLGWDKISAIIKVMSDDTAMLLALADNEHEPLTDYELARSYDRYLKSGSDASQSAIAKRLGINRSVVSRCLDLMKLNPAILAVLDKQPGLITANYAKRFVELSVDHLHIVECQVLGMVEKGTKQEQALRAISQKIAACANQRAPAFVPKAIAGIGTIKVTGQKVELKCEKGVNAHNLLEQFEQFLLTLDRSTLTNVEQ
jgi:ParB family chromosome partitioning protein